MNRSSADEPSVPESTAEAPKAAPQPGAVAEPRADYAPFDFATRVQQAPAHPGVYLMKDRRDRVVYVGKAKSLRARLRQYLLRQDERFFVDLLDRVLGGIELVLTATEKDALLLENELIKKHQPRYNIELKDDKRFIHLRLGREHAFPRLEVVRRPRDDGARYFGPYASAASARSTLAQVNRHFKLRTCTDSVFRNRSRPCLEFQIKRCPAPCVQAVDESDYAAHLRDVELFLTGRGKELVDELRLRMVAAATAEDFERAAVLRDQWRAVERSLERQHVALLDRLKRDIDAIGMHREGARMSVAVLQFRGGMLAGSQGYALADQEFPDDEVVAGFAERYYDRGHPVPDEVLLPRVIEAPATLAGWLTDLRHQAGGPQRAVTVRHPTRGLKAQLCRMATDNAEQVFADRLRPLRNDAEVMEGLRSRLGLRALPRRIECFDVSNIQGTDPVASMAVFIDAQPANQAGRRFKVRGKQTPDDFAMMYEVLCRRFEHGEADGWPLPDLLVVDGGPGQLKMAVNALRDLGVHDVEAVGLAKARTQDSDDRGPARRSPERVWLPDSAHPVVLRQTSNEVYLLTRVRDEAHRMAVTFHRQRRGARTLTSALDTVPGVGPTRRTALLKHFGSVRGLRKASIAELCAAPGIGPDTAARIHSALNTSGS